MRCGSGVAGVLTPAFVERETHGCSPLPGEIRHSLERAANLLRDAQQVASR